MASLCFLNSPLDDDHKDRNTHRMMTRHLALHWLVIDTSWDVEQEVVDTHVDLFPLVIGLGQEGRKEESSALIQSVKQTRSLPIQRWPSSESYYLDSGSHSLLSILSS